MKLILLILLALTGNTKGFVVVSTPGFSAAPPPIFASSCFERPAKNVFPQRFSHSPLILKAANQPPVESESSWRINPFFASLWILLLGIAVLSPGEIGSAQDSALIEAYIANPSNPEGFNPLFLAVFNLLGLIPAIAASTGVAQGSKRGLPSAPFFGLSAAAGYFSTGFYLALRAPPRTSVTLADTSWITRNILENKIFSWFLVASVVSVFFVTGVVPGFLHGEGEQMLNSYVDLASESKFAFVSSADAVLYNVALAGLIGSDYKLRQPDVSDETAAGVGFSTLVLPFVGPALYCALRPKLPEN